MCARLADGGTIAVFGGGRERGHASLHGLVTHVHFSLERGPYLLAFRMTEYSVLVTDLARPGDGEEGGFLVSRAPLDLGVVRPSVGFTYEGD